MISLSKILRCVMLGLCFAAVIALAAAAGSRAPRTGLASAGLSGSKGSMQPVNLPARVSRITVVPGSSGKEAWAIGHSLSKVQGWDQDSPSGQLVLMHYTSSGWDIFGPPTDASGNPINPVLSNLALASNGEGWAVGPGGAILHHQPGGGWISVGCPQVTCSDLYSVSLREEGGGLTGFAVGASNTVLKLNGGAWAPDDRPVAASDVTLVGVVANPNGDAWAVGQTASRELTILRREVAGWTRQLTGKALFDNPFPASTDRAAVNLAVVGNAIGATPDGREVWVGGGFYPVDPGNSLGDAERPFTIRWSESGVTSGRAYEAYCPRLYSVSNGQVATEDICEKPMPAARTNITSFSVLPSGEVLAGGMGLFHFKDGVWFREPDSVGYLSSVSFASAEEGWVATTGDTVGVGGAARSSSITVGHYTANNASTPRSARWPHFNREVLKGTAVAPDGKRALAVGDNGTVMTYLPAVGWDKLARRTFNSFNAAAWSSSDEAWAVGSQGLIAQIRGRKVDVKYDQEMLVGEGLMSVAFSSGRGYAVGASGSIVHYGSGAWRKDPQSGGLTRKHLYSVTAHGNGFVAVGQNGILLRNTSGAPGDWTIDDSIVSAISRPRVPTPTLFSVQSLPDGTLIAAGSRGTLVQSSGGGWSTAGDPVDGEYSFTEAKGARDRQGRLKIFASVSPDLSKFEGDSLSTAQSWLMHFDGDKWVDLDFSHRRTMYETTDLGAGRDPVLAIALEPGGSAGWAVGGTKVNVGDSDGHLAANPSSSILRFDTAGDPKPRNTEVKPRFGDPGVTFAFLAESSCATGKDPCSAAVGSGTTADEVLLAIQNDINEMTTTSSPPGFVVHGGNMRSVGIPEEIGEMAGYLKGFDPPVFSAMGQQDVMSATSNSINTPPGIADAYRRTVDSPQATPGNRPFLTQFKDELKPWGTGTAQDSRFAPVSALKEGEGGRARTYYAFDYAPKGKPLVRFIVLDTSDKSFQKTAVQQVNQNPPLQDQATWFNLVLSQAFNQQPPLPSVVIMNTPTVNPTTSVENDRLGMLTDGISFETNASGSLGVSAVLTGLVHSNSVYYVPSDLAPNRVPFFVLGGGGSPLQGTKEPLDGFFHAWQLIQIDTSSVSLLNPQAKVTVRTIPVLESVALNAVDGLFAPGGTGLHFKGLGRGIDGGGPKGDLDQTKRLYLEFPLTERCSDNGPFYGSCFASTALTPDYHFTSDNPEMATFVQEDPAKPGSPFVSNGYIIPDDQSGFLCTFKAGSTNVNLTSGRRRARMPITIGAGFGPCVKYPVLGLPSVPSLTPGKPQPLIAEAPAAPESPRFFLGPPLPQPLVVVIPPVPGPIAAPAPPAAASTSRKEEEEHQSQSEGQEGDGADFRAIPRRAHQNDFDPLMTWLTLFTVAWMGLMGAIAVNHVRRRDQAIAYVRWRS